MGEELKRILNMVEEGIVSADEAEKLIDAINKNEDVGGYLSEQKDRKNKFIRVRISESGKSKVNINLPLSLVDMATKIGTKFIPYDEIPHGDELKNIDWNEIGDAIKEGASGKLVDIQDGDDIVEIYVE